MDNESHLRHIAGADRLIRSASRAVSSFYVGEKEAGAARFLRDSEDKPSETTFTTGGTAVGADLWELKPFLPYLKAVLGPEVFAPLAAQRDECSRWLAAPSNPLEFSGTFGSANAYAVSVAAVQACCAGRDSPRTKVFAAMVIAILEGGWPILAGVDEPHPYVASRVSRAAEAVIGQRLHEGLTPADLERALGEAALSETLVNGDDLERAAAAGESLGEAWQVYLEKSQTYLWQQHGLATPTSSSMPTVLSYDPVGTCFALDVLLRAASRANQGDFGPPNFAEYEDLVLLSIRHVLAGMGGSGTLGYGLPFSYSEKGMGAFATSISGLAALARVMNTLFAAGRRALYDNAAFLNELLESNTPLTERLFVLPIAIEGAKLRRRTAAGGDVAGWPTDRAPSMRRIESWVSSDVLSFAVHLRLLLQEIAQFRVVERYGGGHIRNEPRWPYELNRDDFTLRTGDGLLHDPDELGPDEEPSPVWKSLAPVPVLQSTMHKLATRSSETWNIDRASLLLFGPPGTAKSTIAKSLAQELDWHYLELTPSNFVEQGLELIERRSREIFDELGMLRETVILFDELDSLLMDRELLEPGSILNFTVPAMLPKVQRLAKAAKKQRLLLIFATNFYDRLDPAMARRGRIDERILVLPPNATARRRMLAEKLQDPALTQAIDESALGVYEDLKRYRDAVLAGDGPPHPVAGINPALYLSRIPEPAHQRRAMRATERLAVEVAEVVARLLDAPRTLPADADHAAVVDRLNELESELTGPANDDWRNLCGAVRSALS